MAEFGELVVLAVKGGAAAEALRAAGAANVSGKTVIDATNPLTDDPPVNGVHSYFTSLDESLMERLQEEFPEAHFVKAFNQVNIGYMVNPTSTERRLPMSGTIDILNPEKPKRIAFIASNASVSKQTGWLIGFWWSELTHSYWEFAEHGYQMDIYSPDGGALVADSWSDPRDESKYSASDLISLGFICSPEHSKLVENSRQINQLNLGEYDAVLFVGGQGPMYTFYDDDRVHELASSFYRAGKIVAALCHATCILLKTKLNGKLLVEGKTWTGFANSEEAFADSYVGKRIQPFWIEDEARKLPDTNFIVSGRFKPHAVRDGNLITGQQQFSGAAVARLVIEALGV